MGDMIAQVVVAALGIASTLAASLLTQRSAQRAESERRKIEDETRWLPNKLQIASELLTRAGALNRKLYGAAAFLNASDEDVDDRSKWLAGHMNVLSTPKDGLPGTISSEEREILVEIQFEANDELETIESLVSQVVLLFTDAEGKLAHAVLEGLWDAAGMLECYAPPSLAYASLAESQKAIESFATAARQGLRIASTS